MKQELLDKIENKTALIGIIGLGYVGLPLAREFLQAGFKVLGFDVDQGKVNQINQGKSYIQHIPDDFLFEFVLDKQVFTATVDFTRLTEADVVLICVPTPLGHHEEPDLSFVLSTTQTVAKHLRHGQAVVLESTTYPGTTEEEMLPILEKTGLRCGDDFFLGFSPEREDPGNSRFATRDIPKIVSGVTPTCWEVIDAIYSRIVKTVSVSTPRVAEAAKILENTYRAVNIALVNELKLLFDRMGIDVWEVIDAAKTKPFGFQAFYPGPGLGGHCIPIDPFYLTWKAREYNFHTRFIELAGEINNRMPEYVVEKTLHALSLNGRVIAGARVLISGVAYKADVDDLRESPALAIIDTLIKLGAAVDYHDPHIPSLPHTRKFQLDLKSIDLEYLSDGFYDVVIVVTDHQAIDYNVLAAKGKIVVDTRNALGKRGINVPKIFKA